MTGVRCPGRGGLGGLENGTDGGAGWPGGRVAGGVGPELRGGWVPP